MPPEDSTWTSWTTNTSPTSSGNDAWGIWISYDSTSSTTNHTTSGEVIWQAWTSANITYGMDSHGRYVPIGVEPIVVESIPETEEQREARLERERRLREEQEARRVEQARLRWEREAARAEAKRKAEELLRESLDDEQLEQFDATKWFFVIGQSGRMYRIRNGLSGNVDELNESLEIVATHCIHPRIDVPSEDNMLVQKLMLETEEERFLQIANRTVMHAPRPLAV